MQTEYIYPVIGDRLSPKEWAEVGRPNLMETAAAEKARILAMPNDVAFDFETDNAIRDALPIRLKRDW